MKNITKTTKTILFASLIAALILPFSAMEFAEAAPNQKANDKSTKNDLKNDVKKWIKDNKNKKQQDKKAKSIELKGKFAKLLRESIEEVRVETNTRVLTEDEIQSAMFYIVTETIKDEKHKDKSSKNKSKTLNTEDLSAFGIQYADAVCPTTTNPSYKQVEIDIDGGSYGGNTFGGSNDLYIVVYSDNAATCERTYTLYWYDEDHPTLDALYDGLRLSWYGRTYDIETFTIQNNSTIEFDGTWSNSHDFNDTCWVIAGCHDTTTKTWSGGIVYVSNTWNHMMDTSDTNPSLTKVTVP